VCHRRKQHSAQGGLVEQNDDRAANGEPQIPARSNSHVLALCAGWQALPLPWTATGFKSCGQETVRLLRSKRTTTRAAKAAPSDWAMSTRR